MAATMAQGIAGDLPGDSMRMCRLCDCRLARTRLSVAMTAPPFLSVRHDNLTRQSRTRSSASRGRPGSDESR